MTNLKAIKTGRLLDLLAENTDKLTKMMKENFNNEVYQECKQLTDKITEEIRQRKTANQHAGLVQQPPGLG